MGMRDQGGHQLNEKQGAVSAQVLPAFTPCVKLSAHTPLHKQRMYALYSADSRGDHSHATGRWHTAELVG